MFVMICMLLKNDGGLMAKDSTPQSGGWGVQILFTFIL
jgi:hypothetical protein